MKKKEPSLTKVRCKQTHLFYIDSSDFLRDMISADKNASSWNPGPLGTFNFEGSPSSIGLTVFRVGGSDGSDSIDTAAGLRLFYGSKDDRLVHELVLRLGSNDWSAGFIFSGSNGRAGIASKYADAYGTASAYHLKEHGRIRV